jgi:hypothetical protein
MKRGGDHEYISYYMFTCYAERKERIPPSNKEGVPTLKTGIQIED